MHHAIVVFFSCICEITYGIMHRIMHHGIYYFQIAVGDLVKGVGTQLSFEVYVLGDDRSDRFWPPV